MDKLKEHNENLDTRVYLPSHLESLKEKHENFEVPDLETAISRHKNPHRWLQQDIAQIKQFQYRFFQNNIINEDTIPQMKVFSHFLLKYFQLIWEQQDQSAYINFPQVLKETELQAFIIKNTNKHDLSFNITYVELSNYDYDNNFFIEHSETSDKRY